MLIRHHLPILLLLPLGMGAVGCMGMGASHVPPPIGTLEYPGMSFGGDGGAQRLKSVHLNINHEANKARYLVLPNGKRICCYGVTLDALLRAMEIPDEEAQRITSEFRSDDTTFIGELENSSITYSTYLGQPERDAVGIFAHQAHDGNPPIYGIAPSKDGSVLMIRCTRDEVEAVFGKPAKVNGK